MLSVQSHQFGFVRAEFARLEQHVVRHADLSDIVQQRGDFQRFQLLIAPPQIFAHPRAKQRHAAAVQDRVFIPVMQGREQTSQAPAAKSPRAANPRRDRPHLSSARRANAIRPNKIREESVGCVANNGAPSG